VPKCSHIYKFVWILDCLMAEYAKNMTDILYQFVHIAWY